MIIGFLGAVYSCRRYIQVGLSHGLTGWKLSFSTEYFYLLSTLSAKFGQHNQQVLNVNFLAAVQIPFSFRVVASIAMCIVGQYDQQTATSIHRDKKVLRQLGEMVTEAVANMHIDSRKEEQAAYSSMLTFLLPSMSALHLLGLSTTKVMICPELQCEPTWHANVYLPGLVNL